MLQNKYQIYLLITVFIVIITFPVINAQIKIIEDIESSENREMVSFPTIDFSYLDKFPSDFNAYYSDNFSLRSLLIQWHTIFTLDLFEKSPIPDKLIIGKNDWLFLAGNELDPYRGKNNLTNAELEKFKTEFEYRKDYLEKRGCKFYVLVAPIKGAIYSELMPDNAFRIYEKSWGEQLINYLEKNSDINTINLYDKFKSLKQQTEHPLYYKLDNHWNAIGAYYGASEFLNSVHKDFPAVHSTPISEYYITKKDLNKGNILDMLSGIGHLKNRYKDTMFVMEPKKGTVATIDKPVGYACIEGFPYCYEYELNYSIKNSPDTTKPKLLIISDSFGGGFFPFAAEQFSETIKIFDSWRYQLNEPIVEQEKPDVVLLIMLESNVRNLFMYTSSPEIVRPK